MAAAYSIDLRTKALAQVDAGAPKTQIARNLLISRNTLYNWIALHKRTGCLQPGKAPGAKPKIDLEKLREHVRAHPDDTLNEMAEVFGVTGPAIHAALKKLGITRKKRASFSKNATSASARNIKKS